ncbi:hypothetical protein FRC03_012244 [Tulasnella sp. 419]|nr:hypothetical protein FRC03_012244 [Tulasnella sp. 419]
MSSVGLNSIQESEALIHDMLREASSRVNGAKRELEHLQIPKLKKFLQSISRLLDSCMKLKGGEATIKPIAVILMRVDDTILQPILDASRHGELQISESLAEQLQDFFSKVSSLFQPRSPSFTLNYMDQWLGGGGVGPMLSDICPKIEESLKAFQVYPIRSVRI